MLAALLLVVAGQFPVVPSVEYFPFANRVSWQVSHYKHTDPITGRIVVAPESHLEFFTPRRWSQLTPAQQMRPEYRDLWLASHRWNEATQTWSVDPSPRITDPIVQLRLPTVGIQLQPGNPQDEFLTDQRLVFGAL